MRRARKSLESRGIDVSEGYLTDGYFMDREKFDVIMFVDVLEHVAEPASLLGVAAKRAKAGRRYTG